MLCNLFVANSMFTTKWHTDTKNEIVFGESTEHGSKNPSNIQL